MKGLSVKLKLAVWLTVLMATMSALFVVLMLSISNAVVWNTRMSQLTETVRRNLNLVTMQAGKLDVSDGFTFYQNGVSTLVYSKGGALIAGQIPVSFKAAEATFENGVTRTIESSGEQYLVTDLWLALGWEDGLWIRGLMEAPEHDTTNRSLIQMAIISLPVFVLLAALGSYWIAKRTFRPLDTITAAAAAINQAKDLSGRIAMAAGHDEFSTLASTFDRMFERLERSFEAEKQFTADASHELRTPISIIKGACEYAEKYDETPQERKETIAMIHRQATGMAKLISGLLSMTRLDQGTELLQRERIELGGFVRAACTDYGYQDKPISVDASAEAWVLADPALLTRLLQNLLENAFKYQEPSGQVWVTIKRQQQECSLSVRDEGVGIPPQEQEQIWQRFYRVDASRGAQGGTGIGLSMVQQIAHAHGGRMTLESAVGQGSTFTLHLPMAVDWEQQAGEKTLI